MCLSHFSLSPGKQCLLCRSKALCNRFDPYCSCTICVAAADWTCLQVLSTLYIAENVRGDITRNILEVSCQISFDLWLAVTLPHCIAAGVLLAKLFCGCSCCQTILGGPKWLSYQAAPIGMHSSPDMSQTCICDEQPSASEGVRYRQPISYHNDHHLLHAPK